MARQRVFFRRGKKFSGSVDEQGYFIPNNTQEKIKEAMRINRAITKRRAEASSPSEARRYISEQMNRPASAQQLLDSSGNYLGTVFAPPMRKKQFINPYKQAASIKRDYAHEAELKQNKVGIRRLQAQDQYARSRSGRFTAGVQRVFRGIRHPAKSLYRKTAYVPQTITGAAKGGKGRPRGTYDKRYAQFGGVYGYRKFLALQNYKNRLAMAQQAQLSPQEQSTLQQVRYQQQAQMQNPEARIVPDTTGYVDMRKINQDIIDACNAVD